MRFNNEIVAGAGTLTRESIKSPNYVNGSTGWFIGRNGFAEFNSVSIRGTATFTSTTDFYSQSHWSDNSFADDSGTYIGLGGPAERISIQPHRSTNYPTEVWNPAQFEASVNPVGQQPYAHIRSPYNSTLSPAELYLYGESTGSTTSKFFATAADYEFQLYNTSGNVLFSCGAAGGLTGAFDGSWASVGRMSAEGGFVSKNIATQVGGATVSGWTANTQVDSITTNLVNGRLYEIEYWGDFTATTAGTGIQVELRENSSVGSSLRLTRVNIINASDPTFCHLMMPYTAVATGSKTFVITGIRSAGGGLCSRIGGSTNQNSYFVIREVAV